MADSSENGKTPFHEPYRLGGHLVSGIWPYLLPEEFRYFQIPAERHATCLNCPKVVTENFDPVVRCCSYLPRLPNFLVGLALENQHTAPKIAAVIKRGFATPEGMQQSPLQTIASLKEHANDQFGKNQDVVCPFLDRNTKLCGIYPYRNSVCSTFFCVNDGDRVGEEFWDRLQGVIGQMESVLSQWIMDQLGLNCSDYFARFNSLKDKIQQCSNPDTGGWSEMALETLWGSWFGREREFFLKASQLLWDNRDSLYLIAAEQLIRQPVSFEKNLAEQLPADLRREYELEGKAGGTPMRPEDLWYLLEKAERDMWLLPDPHSKWVHGSPMVLEPNDGSQALDGIYKEFPHRVRVGQKTYYLTEQEADWLRQFAAPQAVTAASVSDIEAFDVRVTFCQWRQTGVLVEAALN